MGICNLTPRNQPQMATNGGDEAAVAHKEAHQAFIITKRRQLHDHLPV
jgi:hypothetical protein